MRLVQFQFCLCFAWRKLNYDDNQKNYRCWLSETYGSKIGESNNIKSYQFSKRAFIFQVFVWRNIPQRQICTSPAHESLNMVVCISKIPDWVVMQENNAASWHRTNMVNRKFCQENSKRRLRGNPHVQRVYAIMLLLPSRLTMVIVGICVEMRRSGFSCSSSCQCSL